jgi:hypothetical protein
MWMPVDGIGLRVLLSRSVIVTQQSRRWCIAVLLLLCTTKVGGLTGMYQIDMLLPQTGLVRDSQTKSLLVG